MSPRTTTRTRGALARTSTGPVTPAARRTISCPDCHSDLAEGSVNRRCPTCEELYSAFSKVREHLYTTGSLNLNELAAATGVDMRTLSRLMAAGFLRTGPSPQAKRRFGCDSCGQPTDGTALCSACRARFLGGFTSDGADAPADGHGASARPSGARMHAPRRSRR